WGAWRSSATQTPTPRETTVVGLEMKPVGEPYAGNPHVRFDERGVETERWPHGPKQPRLSSTLPLRKRRAVTARIAKECARWALSSGRGRLRISARHYSACAQPGLPSTGIPHHPSRRTTSRLEPTGRAPQYEAVNRQNRR